MSRQETAIESKPGTGAPSSADARLVEQVRRGDADAVHRFFHDHYPNIYRYLLWLTERPELAEDLTQETFIRAWRALDRFDARLPLRPWLHCIAHREFLRSLRSQRSPVPLNDVAEAVPPRGANWTEAVELREVIRKLPREERAIVVLHYLQGYNSAEIAQILHEPAGTVRYRLSVARERLQCDLSEGDLTYLNERPVTLRQWAWLPLDQMYCLETSLTAGSAGQGPSGVRDREAPGDGSRKEEEMERREFLRQTAVGAMGLLLPEAEREVVDSRLAQKVTLAFKGTALSDLCEQLHTQTGIQMAAGPSVADEKVTLFCGKLPLREVMRQLSRPFGYTWVRSGAADKYRYELVQDLRSQLLEEELRNRDRNAALLALEHEIEKYRPYLDLAPDEALERAKTAPPEERKRMEQYASPGWGLAQLYFRLSPQQLAALRAGQPLLFSPSPEPGQQLLPPDLERGVLQSQRDHRLLKRDEGFDWGWAPDFADGLPLTAIPEARPVLSLIIGQTDLGQFTLAGGVGFAIGIAPSKPLADWQEGVASFAFGHDNTFAIGNPSGGYFIVNENLATGQRPASGNPKNEAINARLAGDPALRRPVSIHPQPSCMSGPSPSPSAHREGPAVGQPEVPTEVKVTTADVLEALHRATGMPIVADFYTRLYPPGAVSVQAQPLFEALNQLSDTMHLRWRKEGKWLQFRSVTFYHDRLKEVPNRLLTHWAASRRERGMLAPDDLIEIAQLSDTQLDAAQMAEGAREYWGLKEWDLARARHLRTHLRFCAGLTSEQRREAMRSEGLAFTRMSLPQQQQFLALALGAQAGALRLDLEDLASASLQVKYQVPGGLQWEAPEQPDGPRKLIPRPPPPEIWRQRVLAAARRRHDHRPEDEVLAEELPGLQPEPDLEFIYLIGAARERPIRRWVHISGGNSP